MKTLSRIIGGLIIAAAYVGGIGASLYLLILAIMDVVELVNADTVVGFLDITGVIWKLLLRELAAIAIIIVGWVIGGVFLGYGG